MSRVLPLSMLVVSLLACGAAHGQTRNPFARPSLQEATAPAAAPAATPAPTGGAKAPRTATTKATPALVRPEPVGLPLPPALPPALVAGARGTLPALTATTGGAPAGAEQQDATVAPAAPETRAFLTRDEIQARRSRCPVGLVAGGTAVKAPAGGDLLVLKLTAAGCAQGVSASDDWVSARLTSAGTIELVVEPNEEHTVRRTVLVVATPTASESVTIQQAAAVK